MTSKSVSLSGGARRRKSKTSSKKTSTKGKKMSKKMSGGASRKKSKTASRNRMSGGARKSKRGSKSKKQSKLRLRGGNPPTRQGAVKQASPPEKIAAMCEIPSTFKIADCVDKNGYDQLFKIHQDISLNMSCKPEQKSAADKIMRSCDTIKQTGKVVGTNPDGYAAMGTPKTATYVNVPPARK